MADTPRHIKDRSAVVALSILAASVVSLLVVFKLVGHTHGIIVVWPLAAVQLAFLVPHWKQSKIRLLGLAAGGVGTLLGSLLSGLPLWFACSIVCASVVDVWLAGTILSRGIQGFEDLKRRDNLIVFVTAAIVAPAVSSLINTWPLARFLHISALRAYPFSSLCDSLGMAIIFPSLLFLLTGDKRRPAELKILLRTGAGPALLFIAVAGFVFYQTSAPLLFMVFAAMVFSLLASGLEGAIFVILSLSIIASLGTAQGHGPFWLVKEGNYEQRLLLLQMFIWMSVATALPIGALLDERKASEKSALESRLVYRILLENAEHMVILSTIDGQRRYVSSACERLTGFTPEEYAAKDRMEMLHPEDRHQAEQAIQSLIRGNREHTMRYRIALKRGGWKWVESTARAYFDHGSMALRGYVATIRTLPEVREAAEIAAAHEQASAAGRLPVRNGKREVVEGHEGRELFDAALLNQSLAARINYGSVAIILFQIDHFRAFMDEYGVLRGDECLKAVAEALNSNVGRVNDLVVRWGDAFRVLLPGAGLADAERIANKMLEEVRAAKIQNQRSPLGQITASAGVAVSTHQLLGDPQLLVKHAEQALAVSQQTGRDRVTIAQAPFHLEAAASPDTLADSSVLEVWERPAESADSIPLIPGSGAAGSRSAEYAPDTIFPA